MEQEFALTTTNVERSEDNYIVELTEQKNVSFCSMTAETKEEKAALFNAVNNAEKRLTECINMEIQVKDVFVEVVNCTNEETGEVTRCPRTVLIDTKGVGYTAVSLGVFSALRKLFQVFGTPTWEEPLTIIPRQISRGNKKITTLGVKTK